MKTHIETTIHQCRTFRVARVYPNIGNAITLEISTDTGTYELTMFNLPAVTTTALRAIFADENTSVKETATLESGGVAA